MVLLFEKREERLSELVPKKKEKQLPKEGHEKMSLVRLMRRMEAARLGGKKSYEEN